MAFIVVAWLRREFGLADYSPLAVTFIVSAGFLLLVLIASIGSAKRARGTQPASLLRAG